MIKGQKDVLIWMLCALRKWQDGVVIKIEKIVRSWSGSSFRVQFVHVNSAVLIRHSSEDAKQKAAYMSLEFMGEVWDEDIHVEIISIQMVF